jgi:hypothetical protein
MSALQSLKLVNQRRPNALPPVLHRRRKLDTKLWEQIQLAQAQAEGNTYSVKRFKTVRDVDGVSRSVELQKRVRPWWFVAENGKVCLNVRYGNRVLELAKGKSAVEVATPAELVNTLEQIRKAVVDGELDSQIDAASGAVKAGFKK